MTDALARRLRISELSRRTNTAHATIQFWVREGLLPTPVKTGRTMAYYDPSCIERIAVIKELQQRYLPLNVIRRLVNERASRRTAIEEVSEHVQEALVPAERALSREQVMSKLRLPVEVLDEMEQHGIVGPLVDGAYAPHDVMILRAAAKLGHAGLNRDAGFETKDLHIYLDAMRSLVATEVTTFLSRVPARGVSDMARLGIVAATSATELMVAFRQKVIAQAVASLPKRTAKRTRKRR